MNRTARRGSYIFLSTLPFLDVILVGVRAFRISGVYQVVGAALCAAVVLAAWLLGARAIGFGPPSGRRLALTGALFVLPWTIISLLWIGLGAPFQATLAENYMRQLVLLANSIIVTSAFIALKGELDDANERFYSTLGFAAGILAGIAYIVALGLDVGVVSGALHGENAAGPAVLRNFYSVMEFVACVLTYAATAAFAASIGQAQWLGVRAARAYVIASVLLLLLVVMRGISFPELSGSTAPWYVRPGFVAGIPAFHGSCLASWASSCSGALGIKRCETPRRRSLCLVLRGVAHE